ncbi:hypothetical protein AAIE21_26690 [Paenibacillus sp. 102]|uniref:hypothetical protein n=1 Tax=Paenibacillus sp. 102 TaxID=3120823 RepID=UPI0031BB36FA
MSNKILIQEIIKRIKELDKQLDFIERKRNIIKCEIYKLLKEEAKHRENIDKKGRSLGNANQQ